MDDPSDIWYTFRSKTNGLMVQVTNNHKVRAYGRHITPGGWEKMKIESVPNSDKLYTIKSMHGKFFWVDRDGNVAANKDIA